MSTDKAQVWGFWLLFRWTFLQAFVKVMAFLPDISTTKFLLTELIHIFRK